MTVTRIATPHEYVGVSGDTKPTTDDGKPVPAGSSFVERDTGYEFIWDGTAWGRLVQAGGGFTSGWGNYADTLHTTGSPQAITALTDTTVTNNAGSTEEQEVPFDVAAAGGYYDEATNKIRGIRAGDAALFTAEFKVRRASGSGEFTIASWLDIGGGIGPLYERTQNLPGSGERNITFTTAVYMLDTWQANGALFKVNTSVDTELFDKRFIFHTLHRGTGTYGS